MIRKGPLPLMQASRDCIELGWRVAAAYLEEDLAPHFVSETRSEPPSNCEGVGGLNSSVSQGTGLVPREEHGHGSCEESS